MSERSVGAILRRHAPALALLVPMALFEVGLDGGLTLSYRYLIDRAIVPSNGRALAIVLGALGGGVVVASIVALLRDREYAKRVAKILDDVRRAVFDHLLRLSIGAFAQRRSGDLVARFSTDLAGLESALVTAVTAILLPALGVAVGVGLLFVVLDWRGALAAAIVWPPVLIGPRVVTPRAAAAAFDKKEREGALLVAVDEAVQAHRTIKAFGLNDYARMRFLARLGPLSMATTRATFLAALVERSTVVTIYAVQVGAVAVGAYLAYARWVTVGSLVSFLTIFWNLGWSLVVIGRAAPGLVSAAGSARRIDELLAEPEDASDAPGLATAAPLATAIAAEDVTFAYQGKHVALLFASFTIRAGESVAFVGPSGSGKSTVLSLIARFYDATKGRVTFDGVDTRAIGATSLRAQMAFVMQESFLFDASVRDNIRIGRPDASDAEIEDAAREAEIHDAILAMPQGYDTLVGERGGQLSGGQRQRIAIARALVRKPSVLLLDEASSALDPVSEAAINATLAHAGRGRTTISVTHRLAGAVHSDRIFVVSKSRIVESGTHAELLAKGRVYAELWEKQSGFELSEDGASARVTVERLRAIDLLRPLRDEQLETLARVLTAETASAGRRVIEQGQPGSLFYLIARGVVRVTRQTDDGAETEVARLDDGDQFGELALLKDAPRSATVTCLTDCVFLTLTRAQFHELLATTPEVRAGVERVAAERTRALRGSNLSATLH